MAQCQVWMTWLTREQRQRAACPDEDEQDEEEDHAAAQPADKDWSDVVGVNVFVLLVLWGKGKVCLASPARYQRLYSTAACSTCPPCRLLGPVGSCTGRTIELRCPMMSPRRCWRQRAVCGPRPKQPRLAGARLRQRRALLAYRPKRRRRPGHGPQRPTRRRPRLRTPRLLQLQRGPLGWQVGQTHHPLEPGAAPGRRKSSRPSRRRWLRNQQVQVLLPQLSSRSQGRRRPPANHVQERPRPRPRPLQPLLMRPQSLRRFGA